MGKKLGYSRDELPLTNEIAETMLRLPIYPELSRQDLEYIIDSLRIIFAQIKDAGV